MKSHVEFGRQQPFLSLSLALEARITVRWAELLCIFDRCIPQRIYPFCRSEIGAPGEQEFGCPVWK